MMNDDEQMVPLNSASYDIEQSNQIKKHFNFNINLERIRHLDPEKPVVFQLINRSALNEAIKLVLTNNVLKSLTDLSHQSRSSIDSRREEIISLLKTSDIFYAEQDIPSNDYIEWSLTSDNLMIKRQKFREQIVLYNSYDIRHPLITIQIVEIIQYYIKEYLFREEHFSNNYINKLEEYFKEAIRQRNYFIYFIKAYTMTGNFHRVLNKHLALYILDYFEPSIYISQPGKYRLINCLAHIVGLSVNCPEISQYQYSGIAYRGLIMDEKDLRCYTIGNYILNRSFVSTSKDRSVATTFSGFEQEHDSTKFCVLFKYKIESNRTGLNIERISSIQDEKEVMILPFSVFQVKRRKEIYSKKHSQILHEIYLEECQYNQIHDDLLLVNHRQSRNKYQKIFTSKYSYTFITLCIIISLFVISGFVVILNMNTVFNNSQTMNSRRLKSNIKWKQYATSIAGGNRDGNELDQLSFPYAIYVDDEHRSIYITDNENYRIVKWILGNNHGEIIVGGNGKGNRTNQLGYVTDVILDKVNKSLVICDFSNKQVIRISLEKRQDKQIIIDNITCSGLMMNKNGDLFVSDEEKNEVKKWKKGEKEGTVIAGGNGQGDRLDQLHTPRFIFIDRQDTIYISDLMNHRVMKWIEGAKEGIVVAGGYGKGNSSKQLPYPQGLFVNETGDLYVVDPENHRVMCWPSGAEEGRIVVGGNGPGKGSDQFYLPRDLSFDSENNLYVVDWMNHRVQRFEIDKNVEKIV